MSIATVVTRGYGSGGSVAGVVVRGYLAASGPVEVDSAFQLYWSWGNKGKRRGIADDDEPIPARVEEIIEQVAEVAAVHVKPPRKSLLIARLEAENLAYRAIYAQILADEHRARHAAMLERQRRERQDEESILLLM